MVEFLTDREQPGTVVRAPVELLDVYPTVVDLAGLPAVPGLDGRSLVPLAARPDAPGRGAALSALAQTFQLTPNEMMEINTEIQEEQQPEHLYVLIDHLTEILLHLEEGKEAFENLISYYEQMLESLLKQKDLERMVTILMNLREIKNSLGEEKQTAALRRILETPQNPISSYWSGRS